eukprot:TRINITY_DN104217_c0_g1_i1.p1 TRINITY_DN104217_c0_g1~~TRINITY_DN104217_c0_g1_i1.p1  ORF type:complete len:316 (-),score=91.51 TRINITY_DN104217_c0_g1_i1:267-1214(-)
MMSFWLLAGVAGASSPVETSSPGELSATPAPTLRPICNDIMEVAMEFAIVLLVFFVSTAVVKGRRNNSKKEKAKEKRALAAEPAGHGFSKSPRGQPSSVIAEAEESYMPGPAPQRAGFKETEWAASGLRSRAATAPLAPGPAKAGVSDKKDKEGSSLQWRERAATAVGTGGVSLVALRLGQFIEANHLDPACAKLLRRLPLQQVEWIMDQEWEIQVDPQRGTASSKVVNLVTISNRKTEEYWQSYPTSEDVAKRMETFVQINNLDRRCLHTLSKLSEATLRRIMDQEFVIKVDQAKGTASAKVIGRILQVRNNSA